MMDEQKRTPRPFQREVLRILQQEKRSIILQAPTGAGKTDAVLYPYVHGLEHNGDWLARTCLYATPMRVLCNQFYHKFRGRIEHLDDERGGRLTEIYEKLPREPVSLQTGEQPNDPQFEALLTFCTIDQLLASFLAVPYSMQTGRHNLNVGAVIGSYLVFDEFHLYPLVKEGTDILGARTTVLTMLRLLKEMTRFVLMTATFSTTLLQELAQLLDAVVVKVDDEEELRLISNGRQRTFELVASALNVDTILAQHQRCSLVVCNTVLRAQQCYWELKERAEQAGIELVLLHSRLTHPDREARSSILMYELGQAPRTWTGEQRYGWKDGHYYGKNIIVVATQVVEVGLDISVETLHTELAPANSLIQRAGRCARFARQQGRVLIYEGDAKKAQTTLPYSKALCEKTLLALRDLPPGAVMGFKQEQALIDAVHTEEDQKLLEYYNQQSVIDEYIFESLCTNKRSVVTTLIRDVAQVQVLIHDDPNEAIKQEPWLWQSFGLHPASLAHRWQVLDQRAADLGISWVGRKATLQPESEKGEPDNRQQAQYQWDILPTSKNTNAMRKSLAETLMIVLHPELATYHEELGFVLLDGSLPIASTGYQSTPLLQAKRRNGKHSHDGRAIHVESYQQHINGLMKAYAYSLGGLRDNLRYVATRLEELMGFPAGLVDHAVCLALACHDLGKLGQNWQQWAWSWQRLLEQEGIETTLLPQEPFFFAKTDFDYSKEQRLLQQTMKQKRPNHACESVMLGLDLIADSLGINGSDSPFAPLLYAVCAAIARHHTAQAQTFGDVVLVQGAQRMMRDVLENVKQDASWQYNLSLLETSRVEHGKLDGVVTIPERGREHQLETWLYFVIVRALRLADQRAGIRW